MKHIVLLLSTLAILFTSASLSAKTYYISSSWGSDENDGLSQSAPFASIAKLSSVDLFPGDSVLFNRGDLWKEKFYSSASGTPGNPIYYGAYGDGELPVISAIGEIPGWDNSSNWKNLFGNVWMMKSAFDPQRLSLNGKEVLQIDKPENIKSEKEKWSYNNDSLSVYSVGNPAEYYSSIEGNVLYYNLLIKKQHDIVVENLEIVGGSGNSITIAGSKNIVIRNCTIGKLAWLGIRILQYDGVSSENVLIENNLVDSGFRFIYGPPENRGCEDGILLSAGANSCVVRNNRVLDWTHCGIYCYALREGDNGVYDNLIEGNYISGANVPYTHGIGTDGREGLCRNNEFRRNLIQNTTVRNQINGNNNFVHHNIIDGITNSPVKRGGTAQGFDLQCYGTDLVCHDNHIENNTIMNCEEAGIRFRADKNDKANNYIRNNIIYNCGYNSKDRLENFGIVIDDHSSVKKNFFANNCVYNEGAENVIYYRGKSLTIDEFNSQSNTLDVIRENLFADPLFVDNWKLNDKSPCINKGIPLNYKYDYSGLPAVIGDLPDIGACENQNVVSNIASNKDNELSFSLSQNYPNPFNPSTTISYSIPQKGMVTITVFDILGNEIALLMNEEKEVGRYSVDFNAAGLASGAYIYRVKSKGGILSGKMLLIK